jgi:mannose-6-phosphate isomerase-like protein (cupin superfamily)
MCGFKYGVGGYLDIESVLDEYRLLYETPKLELNLEHLQVERVDTDHIWGREYWIVNCKGGDYGAKILEFKSGYRGSVHSHERKDETLCPLNGEIVIELQDSNGLKEHKLTRGMPLRVEAGRQHRITNTCGEIVYIHETSKFEDEQTTKYEGAYEL